MVAVAAVPAQKAAVEPMAVEDDNFFSRWSRRKVQVRTGQPLPVDVPAAPPAAPVPAASQPLVSRAPAPLQVAAGAAPAPGQSPEPAEAPPALTLDDVAQLTPEGDFKPFMARQVPANVRNAAVRKLFTDPHFNVMDGLDIYIDDYSKPSPLSAADMAGMVSAQFLKLVDDPNEPKPTATSGSTPAGPASQATPDPAAGSDADTATDNAQNTDPATPATAESPVAAPDGQPTDPSSEAIAAPAQPEAPHDHADLQLQPDHAPERESPGRGAG